MLLENVSEDNCPLTLQEELGESNGVSSPNAPEPWRGWAWSPTILQ